MIAVARQAIGMAAMIASQVSSPRLDIGRARHADQAEEDEDEEIAEAVVAEREGSAGVGDRANDREQSEEKIGQPP